MSYYPLQPGDVYVKTNNYGARRPARLVARGRHYATVFYRLTNKPLDPTPRYARLPSVVPIEIVRDA